MITAAEAAKHYLLVPPCDVVIILVKMLDPSSYTTTVTLDVIFGTHHT